MKLMEAYLKKHGPGFAGHGLKVTWEVSGSELSLEFQVQKRLKTTWQTDEVFTSDWTKNWGLWNKDVVEAFIQLRSHPEDTKAPYLEVQVSPLNQPFALIITEPRKTFFAPKALNFTSEVELQEKTWKAKMKLTLPSELKGKDLYGGFFSCLSADPREYYAANPNSEENPDFHRPELFFPLVQ